MTCLTSQTCRSLALALSIALLSAACSNLGLAPVATDPTLRSPSSKALDEQISAELDELFSNDDAFLIARVRALSFEQVVVLYGEAPNAELQQRAEQAASASQPEIKKLYNQVVVDPQYSTPDADADSEISALITSRLLLNPDVDLRRIAYSVDRRNVYLLGRVSEQMQSDIANSVAGVNGVLSVNVFFELMTTQP